MFNKIAFASALLSILFFVTTNSFCQKCKIRSQSNVLADIFPSDKNITEEEKNFVEILTTKLSMAGILASPDVAYLDYKFFVGLKEIPLDSEKEYAATILIMEMLPKEAVEVGAKGEALYKVIQMEKPTNLTEEGRKMREATSASYMKNFGQIENVFIEKIKMKEAGSLCDMIIKDFLKDEKNN